MYVLEKNKGGQVGRGRGISQADQSRLLREVTNAHTMSRNGCLACGFFVFFFCHHRFDYSFIYLLIHLSVCFCLFAFVPLL